MSRASSVHPEAADRPSLCAGTGSPASASSAASEPQRPGAPSPPDSPPASLRTYRRRVRESARGGVCEAEEESPAMRSGSGRRGDNAPPLRGGWGGRVRQVNNARLLVRTLQNKTHKSFERAPFLSGTIANRWTNADALKADTNIKILHFYSASYTEWKCENWYNCSIFFVHSHSARRSWLGAFTVTVSPCFTLSVGSLDLPENTRTNTSLYWIVTPSETKEMFWKLWEDKRFSDKKKGKCLAKM